MEYTVSKIDIQDEKNILTGLIVSKEFTKKIEKVINLKAFKNPIIRKLISWCVEYYKEYEDVPFADIQHLIESKLEEIDETEKEFIDQFMTQLSESYQDMENYNVPFFTKQAEKYFQKRKLEIIADQILADVQADRVDRANQRIATYEKVEVQKISEGIDLYRDIDRVTSVALDKKAMLFSPPDALGEVTGGIRRGDFFTIIAKAKAGKTWLLEQMGVWANVYSHLNVLFLSLEMPELAMKDRFFMNFLGRTAYPYTEPITLPYFDENNSIQYIEKIKEAIDSDSIERMAKQLRMMTKGKKLKLVAKPANEMTVQDLEIMLDNYAYYENFYPDVIVIDYADLLISNARFSEYRHRLDDVWKGLRGLAQKRDCAVISASQANREAFKKDADVSNIAEDIRKFAHVTGAVAINQTPREKERYIVRIKNVGSRYYGASKDDEAIVLQNLHIGRFYLDSRLKKDISLDSM